MLDVHQLFFFKSFTLCATQSNKLALTDGIYPRLCIGRISSELCISMELFCGLLKAHHPASSVAPKFVHVSLDNQSYLTRF